MLPGFFQVIPMGPGRIQLRSARRVIRLSGEGIDEIGLPLLRALDGTASMAELSSSLDIDPVVVEGIVIPLFRKGIVREGADEEQQPAGLSPGSVELYGELGLTPGEVQAAVSGSRVAVLGLGAVGRLAARHLATAGVGALLLVDERAHSAVGPAPPRSNAEVAADQCITTGRTTRSRSVVTLPEQPLDAILGSVTFAIIEDDESGWRAASASDACWAAGVAFVVHMASALDATVGPVLRPPRPPCNSCMAERRLSHLRHLEEHLAFRAWVATQATPRQPTLSSACAAMAAAMLSVEVLRAIAQVPPEGEPAEMLVADFRSLEVRREALLPVPGCRVCGQGGEEVSVCR